MSERRTILLAVALALTGCRPEGVRPAAVQEPSRPAASSVGAGRFEAKMRIMNARMAELRRRNSGLSREVGKLRFLNDQLRKQLAAVGDAPRLRRAYQSQLAKQRLSMERLRKRIEQMEGELAAGAGGSGKRPNRPAASQPGQSGQ